MASDLNKTVQSGSDAITTISMAVAAVANGLALAQAVGAAGNLALTGALVVGGLYTGTGARRMVAVSTNAGDTTQTLTFYGTNRDGVAITEAILLNGVTPVTTVNDFLTVSRIAISALTAGNISAGTSSVATGAWIEIDRVSNNPISIAVLARLVSGAANFGIEETYDDPAGTLNANQAGVLFPAATDPLTGISVGNNYPPIPFDDATLVARAATTQGTITAPFWAFRLKVNSGIGVVQMQSLAALKPWHR